MKDRKGMKEMAPKRAEKMHSRGHPVNEIKPSWNVDLIHLHALHGNLN